MTSFNADLYFNEQLNEYLNTYSNLIIQRLENSRDKAFSLEKARDEIRDRNAELFKFEFNGRIIHDSYRGHIVDEFELIYKAFITQPVETFLNLALPKIKQEDEKDYLRCKETRKDPGYDIGFIENAKTHQIVELIARHYVLNQLWYQISDFLCNLYEDDQTNLNRILYNELADLDKNYFKSQVDPQFPDFRKKLNTYFTKPGSIAVKKRKAGSKAEALMLNVPMDQLDAFLIKLHQLLISYEFIEVKLDEFILHFTSQHFKKIIWKKKDVELVYLIKELDITNQHIHKTTCEHFLNAEGKEFSKENLSAQKAQLKNNYPRIDIILSEMKRNDLIPS